ncbi:3-mercaptopyruvate sulfurtransferase [Rhizobium sp. SAFR-030]|uniref:3-mercaptopyruvate sulfurtransferase n=1 Tax=Rhizobium sp. SAFR-030 TaxID=3387277 RepID=UPI003F818D33
MYAGKSRFVVSADWVEAQLGTPGFKPVDASWYLPVHKRRPLEEFVAGHLPGAVFFDQDEIADHATGLPHSLPTPDQFAESVGLLGLSENDTIVVYDGPGFFSAPRVWWMLRTMGVDKVYVLDGGLDGWKAENRPLETGETQPQPATFTPRLRAKSVTSLAEMRRIVAEGSRQVIDARGAGRFSGDEAEPRPGMRSGHMPGARSMPATIFAENGHFKDLATLKTLMDEAGVDLTKPVTTSCGSGVTAAVVSLALESLGATDLTLYDGSWSEWGSLEDTPVVTGPPTAATPAGPPEPIRTRVTFLEMTSPPRASVPIPVNIQTAIIRAPSIPLHYYRYLYRQVGSRWHWYNRLRLSNEDLSDILSDERNCVMVLYVNGAPAGFFELFQKSEDEVELSYFGLFEHALGLGIGKWFLLQALYTAWQMSPKKVTVSTNTLDHPRALSLYQMMGFAPVATVETWVEPMSDEERLAALKRD